MAGMRDMWREAQRGGAIADFREVYRQAGRHRWRFMALAALCTFGTFYVMVGQSWKKPRPLPEITYITSWPANRTEAETKAFIAENQRRKEKRQAEEAEAAEREKEMYRTLGRMSGMDVDAIEKRAAEDRARDAAAEQARLDAIRKANARN